MSGTHAANEKKGRTQTADRNVSAVGCQRSRFPSASDGKVIPHGIYDLARNEAAIHLNRSCDTSELACESIELWWREQGSDHYSAADELLILCDGGSNRSSHDLFKEDLQALSNRLDVVVRIINKGYETGRKDTENFKKMMTIKFDEHLPKWNYTVIPEHT